MKTAFNPTLVGEYRGKRADAYSMVDRTTGKPISGVSHSISVELTGKGESGLEEVQLCAFKVAEPLFKACDALKKGQQVRVAFRSFEIDKKVFTGSLVSVEPVK